MSDRREGVTLLEVLLVLALLVLLATLAAPALELARASSHRVRCQSNLRRFGMAIAAYADSHRCYPIGATVEIGAPSREEPAGSARFFANANSALLPFFGEPQLADLYDPALAWSEQDDATLRARIRYFVCPANQDENPAYLPTFGFLVDREGEDAFGLVDYAYCAGSGNTWSLPDQAGMPTVPLDERGMFGLNHVVRPQELVDGPSRIIAMGEAAGGPEWPLRKPTAGSDNSSEPSFDAVHGLAQEAVVPWASPVVDNTVLTVALGRTDYALSSVFASAAEPMDTWPVTASYLDLGPLFGTEVFGGSDSETRTAIGSFRSSHPGGANFLLANRIDPQILKALAALADGTERSAETTAFVAE